jgi:hypothetical protein
VPAPHLVLLLLGAVVLGAALGVGGVWARRMQILRRRAGSFRCGVGPGPSGPWRPGLAQYSAERLSWWPRHSLGGAVRWERQDLVVLGRTPTALHNATGVPMLVLSCGVTHGVEAIPELYLLVDAAASAGLTSWLEAASRNRNIVI